MTPLSSIQTASFRESLAEFQARFDLWLSRFLQVRLRPAEELHPDLAPFFSCLLEYSGRSGKRLRPFLVHLGFRAAVEASAVQTVDDVLPLAAAAEMLHVFALAHDDVMDQSALRRGLPTVHRMWAERHRSNGWRGDADQLGASVAILLGDLALVLADACLDESAVPDRCLRQSREVWQAMREEVIEGQFLDVAASQLSHPAPEDQIRTILSLKSGKYTVERPLHLGACAAGASPQLLEAFTSVGIPLGQAFQIQDDILGLFGDSEATGKPADSDLKEGKSTLLVSRAYSAASPSDRLALMQAWGNPSATDEQIVGAKAAIKGSGALDFARSEAEALAGQARSALLAAPIPEDARLVLSGLISFVLDREA